MTAVPTARGEIDSAELGMVLPHEHVWVRRENAMFQFPHLFDDHAAMDRALWNARLAMDHGVRTIFDATVMGLGRDVRFIARFSELSGLNVVVATGVYTHENLNAYFDSRPETALMDAFLYEIENGIQGTDIKPAFIKCASDHLGLTAAVEKVMRAAARTSARTGLPLIMHSSAKDRGGLDQQDLLESEGVDLTRVTIGHSGDTTDLEYLNQLASRGSYLGMDRFGLEDMLPTDDRSATVAALCAGGYADKLLLAHDCPCTYDRYEAEATRAMRPSWNWGFIPSTVLPDLTARGVDDQDIERMTVTNPRVWLTGDKS